MIWQPIDTAPKDGTVIDVWGHGRRYPGVRWTHWIEPEFQNWEIEQPYDALGGAHWDLPLISPTHWMPLPEPPK